jgi:hypothetical protein
MSVGLLEVGRGLAVFRATGLGKGRNPSFGICKVASCYVVLCKEVCCYTDIVVEVR